MKKYTPDYESGLMEIDDKYGEYVLASEHDAEIAELENRLNMFVNKDISYDEMCGLIVETRMYLINKHKEG